MQSTTVEETPTLCGEALTEAGRLLVAEVAGVCRPTMSWRRVWSTMEKAFGLWCDIRPASDLVIFDRISNRMDQGPASLDAIVLGLLLGAFVEDHNVPAVESKIQALVYIGSPDLLHQTLAADWLRAHSPTTVNILKFLLSEAVRARPARSPGLQARAVFALAPR